MKTANLIYKKALKKLTINDVLRIIFSAFFSKKVLANRKH